MIHGFIDEGKASATSAPSAPSPWANTITLRKQRVIQPYSGFYPLLVGRDQWRFDSMRTVYTLEGCRDYYPIDQS